MQDTIDTGPRRLRAPGWAIGLSLAVVLAWAIPAAAVAAGEGGQNASTAYPDALQKMVASGKLTVVKQFATDKPGLTGYVVKSGASTGIVYGVDGYLLTGQLFGPHSRNLSRQYAREYTPKPDVGKVIAGLEKTGHLISQGPDDAPTLYVFADPNCVYCHRFYERAEPLVKAGKLRLQWVIVGFLKPSSAGKAAAILGANDPLAALKENENGFTEQPEQGGIEPAAHPSDALMAVIQNNEKAMSAAGGTGTPTLLYTSGDGQWASKVGVPAKQWLQDYAGHSPCGGS